MMKSWAATTFVVAIVLLACVATNVRAISVKTAEYEVNTITLLNSKTTAAVVNITFDEEVYQVKAINCPPAVGVHACDPTIDRCACDYRHGANCGVVPADCPFSCNTTLCDTDLFHWVDVIEGQPAIMPGDWDMSTGDFQVRYFNNDPCKAFKIKIASKYEQSYVSYSYVGPSRTYDRVDLEWRFPSELSFCPYDSDLYSIYQTGTLFVSVGYFVSNFLDTEISVYSEKTATELIDKPVIDVTWVLGVNTTTHTAIKDGVPIDLSITSGDYEFHYFTFTVTECSVVSASVFVYYGYDADLMMSYTEPMPSAEVGKADLMGARYGEDYITFAMCPDEGKTNKTAFFTVMMSPLDLEHNQTAGPLRFSVTTQSNKYLVPLNTGYPRQRVFELLSSVQLHYQDKLFGCVDFVYACTGISGFFSINNPNIFNPINNFLYAEMLTDLMGHRFDPLVKQETASNNTFMALAILSYHRGLTKGTPIDENMLVEGRIQFMGLIVDKNFKPVPAPTQSLTKRAAECEYDAYHKIMEDMQTSIATLTDKDSNLYQATQNRINLDLLTQYNAWSRCQIFGQQYAPIGVESVLVNISSCTVAESDPAFGTDPCCNTTLGWSQCCAIAERSLVRPAYFGSINRDLARDTCANADCSLGIAESFAQGLANIDSCSTPTEEAKLNEILIYEILRYCKSVSLDAPTVHCNSLADCPAIDGTICNLDQRRCEFPFEHVGSLYAQCIAEHVPQGTQLRFALSSYLGLPANVDNDLLALTFQDFTRFNFCVQARSNNIYINFLGHYSFVDYNAGCSEETSACPQNPQQCFDITCPVPQDGCAHLCFRQWAVQYAIDSPEACSATGGPDCNWLSPGNYCSNSSCHECDDAPQEYCGFCVNGVSCPEVQGTNATDCPAEACLVPYYGLTSYLTRDTGTTCTDIGYCDGCAHCATSADCTSFGHCSDYELFNKHINTTDGTGELGGCLIPETKIYNAYVPTCPAYARFVPNGCVDDAFTTKAECEAVSGNRWYTPHTNKTSCEADMGCKDYDDMLFIASRFNPRFSTKTQEQCELCGKKWTPYWTWNTGRWVGGLVVNPEVKRLNITDAFKWEWHTDFKYFYSTLTQVAADLQYSAIQAEALCRFNKIRTNLENIVCDCTATGRADGNCYVTTPETLDTLIRVCVGIGISFTTTTASLTFGDNSVDALCSTVLVYELNSQIFQVPEPVRLASYFAAFQTVDSKAVQNPKGGVIGQVLGDGIVLDASSDIKFVSMCINVDVSDINANYKEFDFANVNADYTQVTPYEVKNIVYDAQHGTLCGNVNITAGDSIFLPIKRLSQWRDVEKVYFSDSARAMLLTLGVFYIVVAAFAFFLLVATVIFHITGAIKKFQVTNVITFAIFTFTLIRCIYFFMVPSGDLSVGGSIAEYILIVFPTFPYFTAFSCVPLVWAVLSTGTLQKTGAASKVNKVVGVINAILYILFIIIVIVFTYTKEVTSSACLGTITESTTLTTGQNAISIVYSVVISVISLAIAVAFIVFGRRVAVMSQSDKVAMRTYKMALVCAFGFGLNCLFILIITGARLNNIGFSFAGLLISEVLPSVFMLGNFGSFTIVKNIIFGKLGISVSASSSASQSGTTSTGSSSSKGTSSMSVSSASSASSASSSTDA